MGMFQKIENLVGSGKNVGYLSFLIFVESACGEENIVVLTTVWCMCVHWCMHVSFCPNLSGP